MAYTTLATASQLQKWDAEYLLTYVRDSGFEPYMSKGQNSVIHIKRELMGAGKQINIPLITDLTGAGVSGSTALIGNEESLDNHNMAIVVDWLRNAVTIKKPEEQWTEMDLRAAARERLQTWSRATLRDDLIAAMSSIWSGSASVAYGSATAAERDAWLDNNLDRVLFGAAKSNVSQSAPAGGATNDHSASLANVDNTADKLTAASISLMKRMAKTATPGIRPMRHRKNGTQEYFVAFANSMSFRDLKEDLNSINRDARPRDVSKNPIFQDGDLLYDGVIIREEPKIPAYAEGAGGIEVAPLFFCGAQAAAVAWGQLPKSTKKAESDYDFETGIGIEECRGIEKLVFNNKDHGIVTGWFAAVADA